MLENPRRRERRHQQTCGDRPRCNSSGAARRAPAANALRCGGRQLRDIALALRTGDDLLDIELAPGVDGAALLQPVLQGHVPRDRHQVRFRAPNGLVVWNPQQPEEDLLYEVRDVRGVAHAPAQELTQPRALIGRKLRNHLVFVLDAHPSASNDDDALS